MRCGKGCPATAGHPRKLSKKDSGGLPERWKNRELSKEDSRVCLKGGSVGSFRRKIPEEIEKQGENQNEYIIKMDQRFSAGT